MLQKKGGVVLQNEIGKRIAELRRERGMNQEELAELELEEDEKKRRLAILNDKVKDAHLKSNENKLNVKNVQTIKKL